MVQAPVAKLVSEHRDDLLLVHLIDQGVVEYNVLVLEESVKVCCNRN